MARELGFNTTDIDAIEHRDERDLREQIHQLFEKWKMGQGRAASVENLTEAVKRSDLPQDNLVELQRALPGVYQCLFTGFTTVVPFLSLSPTVLCSMSRSGLCCWEKCCCS